MARRKQEDTAPTSNLGAARTGDRRVALERLRDTLAAALDDCEPQMAAQIAGQYRQTLADLDALTPVAKTSKFDELAAKRKARNA